MPNYSGEGASSEAAPTIINSVEASSIDSAISLMNTYISKRINLSHCKAIIISETLASDGVSSILFSLINKTEIRPDTNIIVSKCEAKQFIENTHTTLEVLIAKFYEVVPASSEYTGYSSNVKLGDFFNKFVCNTSEPIAMLGGISTKTTESAARN